MDHHDRAGGVVSLTILDRQEIGSSKACTATVLADLPKTPAETVAGIRIRDPRKTARLNGCLDMILLIWTSLADISQIDCARE